jgi:hypothetical protein
MSLFGFNQERQVRMPSTRQGEVRVKKRHSVKANSTRDVVDTVSNEPKKVARTKDSVNLPFLVTEQTNGFEDVLFRMTTLQEVVNRMDQKFDMFVVAHDDLVCQFQRRAEEDGVVVSAQKDIIEQWKQEAGALVATLRQETAVVKANCEVESPCAPLATVGVVEKDMGDWGSVLAADSVLAAAVTVEKSRSKKKDKSVKVVAPVDVVATKVETVKADDLQAATKMVSKDELKSQKKDKSVKVVAPVDVVATKVETKVETVKADDAPLSFLF